MKVKIDALAMETKSERFHFGCSTRNPSVFRSSRLIFAKTVDQTVFQTGNDDFQCAQFQSKFVVQTFVFDTEEKTKRFESIETKQNVSLYH